MPTDNELLQKIALGDEIAFRHFFETNKSKLFNYLFKVCKSREIAEELLIDVFFKIWMGRELITEVQNMDAFLFTVAKNKALDFFKLAARNKKLQHYISGEMFAARAKEADADLMEMEYNKVLQRAICQLSPKRKEIFMMSREEGMTHEQIAQSLNLSRNTVKNTITESLKSIKQFLSGNGISRFLISLFVIIIF